MRQIVTIIYVIFFISSGAAIAGGGHEHDHGHSHDNSSHAHEPISADSASHKAKEKIAQLVKKGKIDASWTELEPTSVEQKTFAKGVEWVVVFKNPKVNDSTKQTLYLFYSLDGHYIAANYTGQ